MHIGLAALLFYFNTEWLMPRYWYRKNKLPYFLWVIVGISMVSVLRLVLGIRLAQAFSIDLSQEILVSLKDSEASRIIISTVFAVGAGIANRLLLTYFLKKHQESRQKPPPSITLRANLQDHKVLLEDILYLESMKEYVRVHRKNQPPLVVYARLSDLEARLGEGFLRTHRSFVVNSQYVTAYNSTNLQLGETPIKISRTYKEGVLGHLQGG